MKTKFETNVASELPKTKSSQEPGLPWKVSSEDLEKVASMGSEYKAAITGTPPLKVRAIFLVMLIAAIFIAMLYFVSTIAMEGESVKKAVKGKERMLVSLKTDMERINGANGELNKNLSDLQKKVGELTAQKDLFTAVIESLAKKTDSEIAKGQPETGNVSKDAAAVTAPVS